MNTLVGNIIYLAVLAFCAALVVFGLIRVVKVLKDGDPPGQAILAVAAVILGAAIVIWAARDFRGDQILITTIGNWIIQFLTEPMGG
jgi:membrane protease YdiL (CAAX protease family)